MKKIFLILILGLVLCMTGCKSNKEKVPLEQLYGQYEFEECEFINPLSGQTKEQINAKYEDVARFTIKETVFSFYDSNSTTPAISLKSINYKEEDINTGINNSDVKKLLKNASTRYDIYRVADSQGYSIIFSGDDIYFVEFRFLSSREHVVWQVFEIEKRD